MTEFEKVESHDDDLQPNLRESHFEVQLRETIDSFLKAANDQLNSYGDREETMYYSLDVIEQKDTVIIVFKHSNTISNEEIQKHLQSGTLPQ